MDTVPGHTLYVRNLDEKLHPDRMKLVLYTTFSRYGSVIRVYYSRKQRTRGQAWIVFKDSDRAAEARKHLSGKELFRKALYIEFAKTKSDIISQKDGTFKPRLRETSSNPQTNLSKPANESQVTGAAKKQTASEAILLANNPPHNVLIARNIRGDINTSFLDQHFSKCIGFRGSRIVPSKNIAFIDFDTTSNAMKAMESMNLVVTDDGHEFQLNYAK